MQSIVVLPTYNEAENLAPMVQAIFQELPKTHILVVDDHSPDGTGDLADELANKHSEKLFVLHRPGKAGLGKAYLAGFQYCIEKSYDHIIQMDADFSHPTSLLPKLVETLGTYDFALGSRYVPGGGIDNWGKIRQFISKAGNLYAKWVLGQSVQDLTGGYKAFNNKVLKFLLQCPIDSVGYTFQIETTVRAIREGFSYQEIPFTFSERRHGTSKMSQGIILEAFLKVLQLRKTLRSQKVPTPETVTSVTPN